MIKISFEDPNNILFQIEDIESTISELKRKIEENGFIFGDVTLGSEDYSLKKDDPQWLKNYLKRISLYREKLFVILKIIESFGSETVPNDLSNSLKSEKVIGFLNKIFLRAGLEFFMKDYSPDSSRSNWVVGLMMLRMITSFYEKGFGDLFSIFLDEYSAKISKSEEMRLLLDPLYNFIMRKLGNLVPKFDPERLARGVEKILEEMPIDFEGNENKKNKEEGNKERNDEESDKEL